MSGAIKKFARKTTQWDPVTKYVRGHVGVVDKSMGNAESALPWVAAVAASIYTGNTAPLQAVAAGSAIESQRRQSKRLQGLLAQGNRGAPSIDEAMARQQENDRFRRRQGVLANIYGGAKPSTPTVGIKTLLGE